MPLNYSGWHIQPGPKELILTKEKHLAAERGHLLTPTTQPGASLALTH
jgi:hypothetical protein